MTSTGLRRPSYFYFYFYLSMTGGPNEFHPRIPFYLASFFPTASSKNFFTKNGRLEQIGDYTLSNYTALTDSFSIKHFFK